MTSLAICAPISRTASKGLIRTMKLLDLVSLTSFDPRVEQVDAAFIWRQRVRQSKGRGFHHGVSYRRCSSQDGTETKAYASISQREMITRHIPYTNQEKCTCCYPAQDTASFLSIPSPGMGNPRRIELHRWCAQQRP